MYNQCCEDGKMEVPARITRSYILLTLACALAGSANAQFIQQGGKLAAAAPGADQGSSVVLSADGNTAIVGGTNDNNGAGAAWVYTCSGGVWTQQGSKLAGSGATPGITQQGTSVSLSGDGNTAIMGGPGDNSGAGAAWVYTRSGGVWTQQGSKLVGAGTSVIGIVAVGASQGSSVALSSDGNTAIVGGPFDGSGVGAAWVYTRSGGVWTQQGSKLAGTGAVRGVVGYGAHQGSSVALSADGNTAIVGDDGVSGGYLYGVGGAREWTRSAGVWTHQDGELVGAGAVGNEVLEGSSVALSGDGSTVIMGGPDDNCDAGGVCPGAAWVFVSSASSSGPSIASGGVVNGASFLPGIAPGSWITVEGTNLSATTRTWNSSDFSGSNLPTQLDGVSVSVGGQPAYISYISPTQINALAPNVGTGTVSVTVTDSGATSSVVGAVSQTVQPAFFQWGAYAVATRQDYSLAVRNGTFSGLTTAPAKPGDIIILWGTGFGPTSPPAPVGIEVPPSPTYYTASAVTATVGNTAATVYGVALAPGYAGLYQVAIQIPSSLANGDYPVIATAAGAQSPSGTLITVQN